MAYWDPLKFNWPAYVFIVLWHVLLFYWLIATSAKSRYFSHSTVTINNGEIVVDRSFVTVVPGSETTPIRAIGQVNVVHDDNFIAMTLNDGDLRFVDFANKSQAKNMVGAIVQRKQPG